MRQLAKVDELPRSPYDDAALETRVIRQGDRTMARMIWTAGLGLVAVLAAQPASAQQAAAPTFARDVAPILYDKCVSCHRPGEVAPMSLLTYQEVRPWAKT